MPVTVAEWTACPLTMREVSRSNPGNLPLLQMWHVGNATSFHAIYAYTVYTPIGGKGRCHTSCDLQDHSMQARKSAGEISTLALKPMRKDT